MPFSVWSENRLIRPQGARPRSFFVPALECQALPHECQALVLLNRLIDGATQFLSRGLSPNGDCPRANGMGS
jgi:hypothetical protein